MAFFLYLIESFSRHTIKTEFLLHILTGLKKVAKMDQSKARVSGGLPGAPQAWLSQAVLWVLF